MLANWVPHLFLLVAFTRMIIYYKKNKKKKLVYENNRKEEMKRKIGEKRKKNTKGRRINSDLFIAFQCIRNRFQ